MKKNSILSGLFCVLAAGAVACSSTKDTTPAPAEGSDHVGTAEQRVIGAITAQPLAFSAWPAGPVAFNAGIWTMPIAIWSSAPLGLLAFDIPGVTGLTLTAGAFGVDGAFAPFSNFGAAVPISAPFLTGIQAGLASPFISPVGLTAPAVVPGPAIAAPFLTTVPAAASLSAFNAGITSRALMFNNLAATAATSPLIINVGFTWPASLQFGALNVFAASADATAAFLNTSSAVAVQSASIQASNAASFAFTNTLFPLTFIAPVGTLPASILW